MPEIASIPTPASSPALASAAASYLHARAGAFVLAPIRALTLVPKHSSMIRITCGSAWVTLGDGVDHFLAAEQSLIAPAGSHVVMESLRKDEAVKFDWQPVLAPSREWCALRSSVQEVAVQAGLAPSPLAQALLDLRGAAALAARGLAGLAGALAAGLVRGLGAGFAVLARSAHSSASAAQGRMAS
jgi:hypothetical protein